MSRQMVSGRALRRAAFERLALMVMGQIEAAEAGGEPAKVDRNARMVTSLARATQAVSALDSPPARGGGAGSAEPGPDTEETDMDENDPGRAERLQLEFKSRLARLADVIAARRDPRGVGTEGVDRGEADPGLARSAEPPGSP